MRRPEQGSAIVEFVWLAVLLLVPLVYVVLSVFTAQRAAYAGSAAARSATRAFVTAPDRASADLRARAAARQAFADQGLVDAVDVEVRCTPDPARCLVPGAVVHVRLRTRVLLPLVPSALGDQAPSIAVDVEHAAPYGTYREARE